eukprot:jgi/Botrbrau1/1166/Bobra.0162s0054.1
MNAILRSSTTSAVVSTGVQALSATNRRRLTAKALQATVDPIRQLPDIVETRGVPIFLYTRREDVETEALQQLIKLAESPLPVGFVSAMPDVHLGKGVTIGTVFASDKYVCPNAVGVDIGCGMCAVPFKDLQKEELSLKQLQRLQALIKDHIPTGFKEHSRPLKKARETLDLISSRAGPTPRLQKAAAVDKVAKQLGTLGGGNHFLEVVADETGEVWIMLHSGSRNIGNTTAQHHDQVAREQMRKRGITATGGLNYLELESQEGQAYLQDMEWCQQYAAENRRYMRDIMTEIVWDVARAEPDLGRSVNIHHNYCTCQSCSYTDPLTGEEVRNRRLWVTRKGATSAQEGQLGIIPGSMGTGSFIVRGRGEPQSWASCSHGAGRAMSRTQAKALIPQADFEAAMKGIVADTNSRVRDEAPQAYKDLSLVMANQTDLVDIVHRLTPLVNVKGY